MGPAVLRLYSKYLDVVPSLDGSGKLAAMLSFVDMSIFSSLGINVVTNLILPL